MIRNANDIVYFDGRNCYFDYSRQLFPSREKKSLCGKDVVWLVEAALERKQATRSLDAFPNGSATLQRPLVVDRHPYPLNKAWHVHPNQISSTGGSDVWFLRHATDPSKNWKQIRQRATNVSAAEFMSSYFDTYLQGVRRGWSADGGFANMESLDTGSALRADYMAAAFENLKQSVAYTRVEPHSIPLPYSGLQTLHDYNAAGQISHSTRKWYEFEARGTWFLTSSGSIDYDRGWGWDRFECRGSSSTDGYTIPQVPGGATVELAFIARYSSQSFRDLFTSVEHHGEQIDGELRWEGAGPTKTTPGEFGCYDVTFTENEIASAVYTRFHSILTSRLSPIDVTVAEQNPYVTGSSFTDRAVFPKRYAHLWISEFYLVPRITLGTHTRWW